MIRFIHCADLHFDRSFEGVSVISQEAIHLVEYNLKTLEKIVHHAIQESVDFVLFAGDTFHQNKPTLRTQRLFLEQMVRLEKKGIPVYLCFGNHDYYDEERYWFEFPPNVHLFKEQQVQTIEGITRKNEEYAISSFSYQSPWIEESKVAEFPRRSVVDYHIGMYHGEIGANRYAPFQVGEMSEKGYDYWALGHIHVTTVVQENPLIVYAGTPMGHTKKEIQTKGVALVTLDKKNAPRLEYLDVATIKWAVLEISLKNVHHLKEVLPIMTQYLQEQKTSQVTLAQIVVTDTDQLPSQWLSKSEKKELIAVLNEQASRTQFWIYEIETDEVPEEEKEVFLSFNQEELANSYAHYQKAEPFHEALNELWTQPTLAFLLNHASFKDEVLQRVNHRLTNEMTWKGEN